MIVSKQGGPSANSDSGRFTSNASNCSGVIFYNSYKLKNSSRLTASAF